MLNQGWLEHQIKVHRQFYASFIALVVACHGLYILASTLFEQIVVHRHSRLTSLTIDIPLVIGVSLLYLSGLLRKRKRTAWLVSILAYAFYLFLNIAEILIRSPYSHLPAHRLLGGIILPAIVIGLLLFFQSDFIVKSDIEGFRSATVAIAIVLITAFTYGVAGFSLMDQSDFHQEISFLTAAHYTVDQLNITTSHPLHPYTLRAKLFLDSLSFVSVASVVAALAALFQPIRFRLSDQQAERDRVVLLLKDYPAKSEDFFKLWPHDKQYFFSQTGDSALAFHVSRGVAVVLSDPVGRVDTFSKLLTDFKSLCFSNDWLPAYVHVTGEHRRLFEENELTLQKLGEEAVLNLSSFESKVRGTKYFRQIDNKFKRHGYSAELLKPPHHQAIVERLMAISSDWLSQGGHAERGFVMGYFSPEYLQQCQVMVVRDAAATIQAFANLVPADFDQHEATYDMLRNANAALGNINDFLLMELITILSSQGYSGLNMGLCPLIGLADETDDEKNILIDSVMRFAYANGDRFFSFSGLHRFKAKYEPEWRDRYLAYSGGVRGFSRTITALMRVLRV